MLLQIICSLFAWSLVVVSLWKVWKLGFTGLAYVKKLPEVPCDRCIYFTGDYRLKCTVNPMIALSEDAIGCRDFEAKTYSSKILNIIAINCNCSVKTCQGASLQQTIPRKIK